MSKNIAVVGGGISGIATANILQLNGHRVTIFEKSPRIGGVWAVSYPDVRLQNTWKEYGLANFLWPFEPDQHPTATQILQYFEEAVCQLKLDVCLSHEVVAIHERPDGWTLDIRHDEQTTPHEFDFVVIAVGQYTEGKNVLQFPGQEQFKGLVVSERDVKDLAIFDNKRVVVVGFGKSALDMATFAAARGAKVQHVFRTPRWTLPRKIFGIHYTYILFSRFGSVMMTSWAHPSAAERFLHHNLKFVVDSFWQMLERVMWMNLSAPGRGKGAEAQQRLQTVKPKHTFLSDLRSAVALSPDDYYRHVVDSNITPHHAAVDGFSQAGLLLEGGAELPADVVVLSLGSKMPIFPYIPDSYRDMLECEPDGVQLYRHIIHPHIPNLAFAGFNHGFLHIPTVEVAAVWLCALLDKQLRLPSVEQMEVTMETVRQWKRDNIHFEPSRSLAVNTRYQQYIDILLKDLRINPYRKGINIAAEVFGSYGAKDYSRVLDEYRARPAQTEPFEPLRLDT
jgi:dimethylaniline monooxygenase (N-oxide forming)